MILNLASTTEEERTYYIAKSCDPIRVAGLYQTQFFETWRESDYGPYLATTVFEWTRTVPTDGLLLAATLRQITKRADNILGLIDRTADIETQLEQIADVNTLIQVKGIGRASAAKIIEKLQLHDFDRRSLRLMRLFATFGLPFDPEAKKRARWAKLYFNAHPDETDRFAGNPYHLLKITDAHLFQRVRALRSKHPKENPQGYSLSLIDQRVLAADPRWKYHQGRVEAYLVMAVKQAMNDGWVVNSLDSIRNHLRDRGLTQITDALDQPSVPLTNERLRKLILQNENVALIKTTDQLGQELEGVAFTEVIGWAKFTAEMTNRLAHLREPLFGITEAKKMLQHAVSTAAVPLSSEQTEALRHGFQGRFSAITGGPGTGKSTTLQAFLNGLQFARQARKVPNPRDPSTTVDATAMDIYVLAPSGTAAQRIRLGLELEDPVTGRAVKPQRIGEYPRPQTDFLPYGFTYLGTLHSFLGYVGSGAYRLPEPHPSIIIVDEMSMVDEEPFYQLMLYFHQCLENDIPCQLMLSGDVDQLPPVGPGFPFRDLIASDYGAFVPTTRLNVVRRQGKGSDIVRAAALIRKGDVPPSLSELQEQGQGFYGRDFTWATPANEETLYDMRLLLDNYLTFLHKYVDTSVREEDIQFLIPLRNPSTKEPRALHVKQLNLTLQEHYARQTGNPLVEFDAVHHRNEEFTFKVEFAEGDRVIHVGMNGYHGELHEPIMRGSMGTIQQITDEEILVEYPWLDEPVSYGKEDEFGQIDLAYSITGHAAQGNEFDYILMIIPERAAPGLIDRSWLYTAVTRAKRHLMMVAPSHRIREGLQRQVGMERQTLLARELSKAST